MKNRILLLIVGVVSLGSLAYGDIQSPPGARWNWSRKLSRALANLAYGSTEIPVTYRRANRTEGNNMAAATMVVDGTTRTVVRVGYGLYELVTFPFHSYKGGYKPEYTWRHSNEKMNPYHGYEEFPPQMGFAGQTNYCRTQSW
jgi:putative exosortase-associated protein (TIGR04073 family)